MTGPQRLRGEFAKWKARVPLVASRIDEKRSTERLKSKRQGADREYERCPRSREARRPVTALGNG